MFKHLTCDTAVHGNMENKKDWHECAHSYPKPCAFIAFREKKIIPLLNCKEASLSLFVLGQ